MPIPPLAALRGRVAAAAVVSLALVGSCSVAERPARPDLVVFVVDTLRADRLGCYGYPRATSPTLDALAERGVVFEQAWAMSSWTMPSMIALWTGRYVTSYRDRVFEDRPTLAELLKDEGYRTFAVVSNGLLRPSHGYARGFAHYDIDRGRRRAKNIPPPYRTAEETVQAFEELLEELDPPGGRGAREPYLLYVHLMDPHSPYMPHAELEDVLPSSELERIPRRGWHRDVYRELSQDPAGLWEAGWIRMHQDRAAYDREVRTADAAIGRMLEQLGRRGLLERAVIAVASDHGEGLFDHPLPALPEGLRGKPSDEVFQREHGLTLYQEQLHTPLMLAGVGLPEGLRVAAPVENIDLMATLLDLLAIEPPPHLAQRSLLPLVRGEPGSERAAIHAWVLHAAAIQDVHSGWKLVMPTAYGQTEGGEPALFHLPSDPRQRRNRMEEQPQLAAELGARLSAWIEANPCETTIKRAADPEVLEGLQALGYVDGGVTPVEAAQRSADDENGR